MNNESLDRGSECERLRERFKLLIRDIEYNNIDMIARILLHCRAYPHESSTRSWLNNYWNKQSLSYRRKICNYIDLQKNHPEILFEAMMSGIPFDCVWESFLADRSF